MGQVVRCNYPGDIKKRRIVFVRAPLADAENTVRQRIKTWWASHYLAATFVDILSRSNVDNDHVAGILCFHGIADSKPQNVPFDRGGGFLGLNDDDLFRKCLIVLTGNVVSSADRVASENDLKSGQEFRTTRFDGTQESAWSAVRLLLSARHSNLEPVPQNPTSPMIGSSPSTLMSKVDVNSNALSNRSECVDIPATDERYVWVFNPIDVS